MPAIRLESRETFRDATFLCITPFWALRINSGCAAFNAAAAAALSPEAIASSTLRTEVLVRLRRALLTAVWRAIFRIAFLAERVLAIVNVFPGSDPDGQTNFELSTGCGCGKSIAPQSRFRGLIKALWPSVNKLLVLSKGYLFWKLALRFSTNAVMPSDWSSVANMD